MGEIGVNRREYLYVLRWWEIQCIIKGYRRRQHPHWEQARLIAYSAAHCMGGKNIPTLDKWLPFTWEQKQRRPVQITEEDQARLLAEMERINSKT